jgi:hypothetical protein
MHRLKWQPTNHDFSNPSKSHVASAESARLADEDAGLGEDTRHPSPERFSETGRSCVARIESILYEGGQNCGG